jgi:hypothetical protein
LNTLAAITAKKAGFKSIGDAWADTVTPATLHSPNSIKVSWLSGYNWDMYKLKWSENGGPDTEEDINGDNGPWHSYTLRPAQPGVAYTFQVKGCAKSAFGTGWLGDNSCSPPSDPLVVMAAQNSSSLRTFLQASGIDLTRAVSIRKLGQGALPISLRALLAGF